MRERERERERERDGHRWTEMKRERGRDRQIAWFPGPVMLRVTRARWTTIDSVQNRTESLVHTS